MSVLQSTGIDTSKFKAHSVRGAATSHAYVTGTPVADILKMADWSSVMSLGLSFISDVISFDQNWHHLYSTSAGGKRLSNDAQIRVIGRTEPEICTKILKKLSEKPQHLAAPS